MGGDDDDRSEFRRALEDVKPLKHDGRRPEPPPRVTPRAPRARPVHFEIEQVGERLRGRALDTDRRHLDRLQRGEPSPEREVDLHGMDAQTAERTVRTALGDAIAAGERCLLVIHGRGRRSGGQPVLKEALPDWLAAPPHGPRIVAFASAPATRGGPGATAVLLRQNR